MNRLYQWFRASGIVPYLGLAAAVGIVFGNSLFNGFVWDDFPLLVESDTYRSLDLVRFFTSPANGLEYLPLRDLSFALDYAAWGMDPFGFHLTNLLLHFLTASAVYLFARAAFRMATPDRDVGNGATAVSFLTALFFAVHPLQGQTVNFITCRNTLLSGLFTFLAAACYVTFLTPGTKRRYFFYAGTLGLFLLALLSKGTSIFLPLFFLLLVFLRRQGTAPALLALVPFAAVAGGALYLFTTIAVKTNIIFSGQRLLAADRLPNAVQSPFFYLAKLLVPFPLSPSYDTTFSRDLPVVGSAAAALVVAVAAAFCLRRRLPFLWLAAAWFTAALLPVLHLMPTSTLVADRYAYLPSFAFFFLTITAAERLTGRRPIIFPAAVTLALLWGAISFRGNRIWQNEEVLWRHTATVAPGNSVALEALILHYCERDDLAQAAPYYRRMLRIDAGSPHCAFFRGRVALRRQEYETAVRQFKTAYAQRNDMVIALLYVGRSYELSGDREMAAAYYRQVVARNLPQFSYYHREALGGLERLAPSR